MAGRHRPTQSPRSAAAPGDPRHVCIAPCRAVPVPTPAPRSPSPGQARPSPSSRSPGRWRWTCSWQPITSTCNRQRGGKRIAVQAMWHSFGLTALSNRGNKASEDSRRRPSSVALGAVALKGPGGRVRQHSRQCLCVRVPACARVCGVGRRAMRRSAKVDLMQALCGRRGACLGKASKPMRGVAPGSSRAEASRDVDVKDGSLAAPAMTAVGLARRRAWRRRRLVRAPGAAAPLPGFLGRGRPSERVTGRAVRRRRRRRPGHAARRGTPRSWRKWRR